MLPSLKLNLCPQKLRYSYVSKESKTVYGTHNNILGVTLQHASSHSLTGVLIMQIGLLYVSQAPRMLATSQVNMLKVICIKP